MVEDETVIAMEVCRLVGDADCVALGPASTVDGAQALLAQTGPDLALLDVNLRGRSVAPLAHLLHADAVPFAVLTGCDAASLEDPLLRAAPGLAKPLDRERLRAWLAVAVESARRR